jgi:hypothetical protein
MSAILATIRNVLSSASSTLPPAVAHGTIVTYIVYEPRRHGIIAARSLEAGRLQAGRFEERVP